MNESIQAIGPHQINRVTDTLVTVRYPATDTTVISMQPDGRFELRPAGTAGPYELARLESDRLVYAPLGSGGGVWLLPYAGDIPNM